mmetsp:Transcript_24684/g.79705  ORF Transcript_24684/g.79705 Transcript_24684/m.79705 type:complete len:307 (+) Transcript_24684:3406-4326(+)
MSAWSQRGSLSHASLVAGQCFSVTASRQTSWPWQWMRRPHRPRGSSTRRYTSRRVSPPRPYGQLSALTSVPHSPSASHSSPTAAWSHPGSWFASSSEAGHSACEARLRQTVLSPQWWNSRSQPHRGSTTVGREAAAAASCCCRRASSSIAPAVIGSVGGALRVHGAPGGSGGDGGGEDGGGGAGGGAVGKHGSAGRPVHLVWIGLPSWNGAQVQTSMPTADADVIAVSHSSCAWMLKHRLGVMSRRPSVSHDDGRTYGSALGSSGKRLPTSVLGTPSSICSFSSWGEVQSACSTPPVSCDSGLSAK